MAYPRGRRTPLKKSYLRKGTKQYRRTVYRRAYFNRRRGVQRKEKKGCDITFGADIDVVNSTNTNAAILLMNGIQEVWVHGTESVVIFGTSPSNWT